MFLTGGPKKKAARRPLLKHVLLTWTIQDTPVQDINVRCGSRPCENAKAINRDRTSYSFNTFSCAHIGLGYWVSPEQLVE